jgi:hypothetical protein
MIFISSIRHNKVRNARNRNHKHDIDSKYLLQLLREQEGKCAYSGHHLGFETGTLNCISLERIDVDLGYVKGNVCLIMQSLNTIDRMCVKSLANNNKAGSGGWNKAKVEYLRSFRERGATE